MTDKPDQTAPDAAVILFDPEDKAELKSLLTKAKAIVDKYPIPTRGTMTSTIFPVFRLHIYLNDLMDYCDEVWVK